MTGFEDYLDRVPDEVKADFEKLFLEDEQQYDEAMDNNENLEEKVEGSSPLPVQKRSCQVDELQMPCIILLLGYVGKMVP